MYTLSMGFRTRARITISMAGLMATFSSKLSKCQFQGSARNGDFRKYILYTELSFTKGALQKEAEWNFLYSFSFHIVPLLKKVFPSGWGSPVPTPLVESSTKIASFFYVISNANRHGEKRFGFLKKNMHNYTTLDEN